MQDKVRVLELDGRVFHIGKMTPQTAIKVKLILGAKLLPLLETIPFQKMASVFGGLGEDDFSLDSFLENLNLDALSKALDVLGKDDTIDRLFSHGLTNCFEKLPAGLTRVLNNDGTYGVQGLEDDPILLLKLVFEAVIWSSKGFFKGDRWKALFGESLDSLQRSAQISTNNSLPPS